MDTKVCQRWRARRERYRPAGEGFIEAHHYLGSYPAALWRAGLYRGGELVGVAVLSQPASQAALEAALPYPDLKRAELGRFCLLDLVPANGESWFLARAWELARRDGFQAIVSHADPMQRRGPEGQLLTPGHVGVIYQACSGCYVGQTARRTWRMFADGSVLSPRAEQKLRSKERGWQYAVEQLVAHGAPAPHGDWHTWRREAIAATTRPVRHPGTHRYLFALERALKRRLPPSQPFPKVVGQAA